MQRSAEVVLGGVDVFHLRSHQQMRAAGLVGNRCAALAQLEGPLDAERLRRRLERAFRLLPELRWQLGRNRRLLPTWRERAQSRVPLLRVRSLARGSSLFATVVRALPKDDGGGQPWRLDLWRGADGRDALVLNWFHPLADARAATRLLRWLGQECRDDELRAPPAEKRFGSADRLVEALEPAERNALSEGYIEHVEQLGERPILSLYTAAGRPRAQGMVAHRLLLSPEQTRTFDRSVRRRARLADTSLVVYAAARMLDRLMAVRGYSPTQQLISVPLSLDPKAGCERMFGNHLTMMMLSLDRDDLADEARAVTTIAAQRRAIVRQKLDLGMLAALHRARVLPGAIYQWVSRRPFDGELASLVVSSPGALDLDTFFGVEVSDVMCVPLITPQPGSMVVATRHRGRLSLVVEHMAPLVSAAEARDALGAFEADLLGHGHADVEM